MRKLGLITPRPRIAFNVRIFGYGSVAIVLGIA